MRCRGSAAVRHAVCVPGGALVLAVAAAAILHQARSVRGEEDPSTLLFVDERNNYVISTAEGGTVLMDGVNMTEQSMLVQMLLNENAALKKRMGALESAIKDMGTKYVKVTTTTTATTVTATTTTTIRQPNYEGLVGMKFSQASGEFEPGAGVRSHDESCQGRTYWASPSTNGKTKPSDEWLMFESTEVTLPEISRLDIYPIHNSQTPKNCKLEFSDDKLNWAVATVFEVKGYHNDDFNALDYTCGWGRWESFEFNPRKAKYWRLWMHDNQGDPDYIALQEVRFWGTLTPIVSQRGLSFEKTSISAKEVSDFGRVVKYTGNVDLHILTFENPTFELTHTKTIEGLFRFAWNTPITRISFPKLTTIKGNLILYRNNNLRSISFPSLIAVDGVIDIIRHAVLDGQLNFGALETMNGRLWMYNNGNDGILDSTAVRKLSLYR